MGVDKYIIYKYNIYIYIYIYIYIWKKQRLLFNVAEIVMKIDAQVYPIVDETEKDNVI